MAAQAQSTEARQGGGNPREEHKKGGGANKENRQPRSAAENLAEIIRNPGKERAIAERIARNIEAFRRSAQEDIDILMAQDFSKRVDIARNKGGIEKADQALQRAMTNVRTIDGLIGVLEEQVKIDLNIADAEKGEETQLQVQVEELKIIRHAVQESIDGTMYRRDKHLTSADNQIAQYRQKIYDGTAPKPYISETPTDTRPALLRSEAEPPKPVSRRNPDFQAMRVDFDRQPDIADEFASLAMEHQLAQKIIEDVDLIRHDGGEATIQDVFDGSVDVATNANVAEWGAEQADIAAKLVKALQEMGSLITSENKDEMRSLVTFSVEANQILEAMTKTLRSQMDRLTGLNQVLYLVSRFEALLTEGEPAFEDVRLALRELLFSDEAKASGGWPRMTEDEAQRILALVQKARATFAQPRKRDVLVQGLQSKAAQTSSIAEGLVGRLTQGVQKERLSLDEKAEYCAEIEQFIAKLAAAQDKITALQPLLTQDAMQSSYARIYDRIDAGDEKGFEAALQEFRDEEAKAKEAEAKTEEAA